MCPATRFLGASARLVRAGRARGLLEGDVVGVGVVDVGGRRVAAWAGDDAVGGDVDRLALVAGGGVVFAPPEAAGDDDLVALGDVFGGPLADGAPDRDVEVLRLAMRSLQSVWPLCRWRRSGSLVRLPLIVSWLMAKPLMLVASRGDRGRPCGP
jgi:hypothetical protein